MEFEVDYNKDLANRFVSDHKLPIPITGNEELFRYYLGTYEKDYGTETKYRSLLNLINDRFDGDPENFLKAYYDIRDGIINAVTENPAFKEFNNMDLGKYTTVKVPEAMVSKNDVYNCSNAGKCFVSFDLKKANFQALRYANPDIVFGCSTYEDFIGRFTDLDYVKESKYTRNVIFGKMNPKRHITVEKFIIDKVRGFLMGDAGFQKMPLKLVSMGSDEIVFEFIGTDSGLVGNADGILQLETKIKEELGFDVRVGIYKLEGCELNGTSGVKKVFFAKKDLLGGNDKLLCVPQQLFPVVYKLYNGQHVSPKDLWMVFDGMEVLLLEHFTLTKF